MGGVQQGNDVLVFSKLKFLSFKSRCNHAFHTSNLTHNNGHRDLEIWMVNSSHSIRHIHESQQPIMQNSLALYTRQGYMTGAWNIRVVRSEEQGYVGSGWRPASPVSRLPMVSRLRWLSVRFSVETFSSQQTAARSNLISQLIFGYDYPRKLFLTCGHCHICKVVLEH